MKQADSADSTSDLGPKLSKEDNVTQKI